MICCRFLMLITLLFIYSLYLVQFLVSTNTIINRSNFSFTGNVFLWMVDWQLPNLFIDKIALLSLFILFAFYKISYRSLSVLRFAMSIIVIWGSYSYLNSTERFGFVNIFLTLFFLFNKLGYPQLLSIYLNNGKNISNFSDNFLTLQCFFLLKSI